MVDPPQRKGRGGPGWPSREELLALRQAAVQARREQANSAEQRRRLDQRLDGLRAGYAPPRSTEPADAGQRELPSTQHDETLAAIAKSVEDAAAAAAIVAEFQETQANLANEQINLLTATADALSRIEADAVEEAKRSEERHRLNTILLTATLIVTAIGLLVAIFAATHA